MLFPHTEGSCFVEFILPFLLRFSRRVLEVSSGFGASDVTNAWRAGVDFGSPGLISWFWSAGHPSSGARLQLARRQQIILVTKMTAVKKQGPEKQGFIWLMEMVMVEVELMDVNDQFEEHRCLAKRDRKDKCGQIDLSGLKLITGIMTRLKYVDEQIMHFTKQADFYGDLDGLGYLVEIWIETSSHKAGYPGYLCRYVGAYFAVYFIDAQTSPALPW